MHNRSFVRGAFILTAANIIDRGIGFIFRIILSNLLGSEGTGVYQIALPIYFVSITFLTSGITAVTSRFVSEERAKGNKKNIFIILKISFVIVIVLGIIISSFLFFNAKFIAKNILHEERAYLPIIIFSPVLIIVATSSVFKGFFQGLINMIPASVSEIIEQIVRVCITLYLFSLFTGIKIEYAASIAVFGIAVGEITSFLLYIIFYKRERKIIEKKIPQEGKLLSKKTVAKNIITTSIPITFSRMIVNIIDLAESIIIPQRLIVSGLTHKEAMSEFGKMSGMAFPLAYMPSVITMSLSITVLPAVSEAAALNKWDMVRIRINQAIGYTTFVAFPAIVLFLTIPEQISMLLYPKSPGVGALVKAVAAGSIFAYMESVVSSILNGLGRQNIVLRNSLIWISVSVIGMYFFTSIPTVRIFGYIYTFIFADALILFLNIIELIKITNLKIDFANWFIKPIIASLAMGATVIFVYTHVLTINVNTWIDIFLSVLAGLFIYISVSSFIKLPYIEDIKKIILLKN